MEFNAVPCIILDHGKSRQKSQISGPFGFCCAAPRHWLLYSEGALLALIPLPPRGAGRLSDGHVL
jgi:hypothetical protein